MPTLTAPSTILECLRAGVDLVKRIDPPEDVSVHVDHHVFEDHADVTVWMFPDSFEDVRAVMCSPVFAGVAWGQQPGSSCSFTFVDGIKVYVRVTRDVMRDGGQA